MPGVWLPESLLPPSPRVNGPYWDVKANCAAEPSGFVCTPMMMLPAGGGGAQLVGMAITLVSIVTASTCANSRPRARILPLKSVVVSNVAELPTRQNTLQALPPLIIRTEAPGAVINVLSISKTQTALGSPWASNVRAPVMNADDGKQWTPGASVSPRMSSARV